MEIITVFSRGTSVEISWKRLLATNMFKTCVTGRIQCEVLTALPFCFSRIKKFPGQQSKI